MFKLVDEWQSWWKMWSIRFFALIGILPEIYNLAVSYNLLEGSTLPALISRTINIIAFAGAVSRLIKQNNLTIPAESTEPETSSK